MAKNRQVEQEGGAGGWMFALGAGAGLALGMFLSGQRQEGRISTSGLVQGARSAAGRIRPGRRRRDPRNQAELTQLEDRVLDAMIRDDILAGRGVDVGAISAGIIELSGSVRSLLEAERAVSLAGAVPGVETVVNRLDVESELARATRLGRGGGREWGGRVSGMGRRRQGHSTDPDQADDAQHHREVALEQTDRREFEDEGVHAEPRLAARPSAAPGNPTTFSEDELDNQEPYGKHAISVPVQPQALNSESRVGEGLMPGTELRLEQADLPVKPHAGDPPADTEGRR
jgi:hypothetical protein